MRFLPAEMSRPGWFRSGDGTLADVPRKVRSNIEITLGGHDPTLSTTSGGTGFCRYLGRSEGASMQHPFGTALPTYQSRRWLSSFPASEVRGRLTPGSRSTTA